MAELLRRLGRRWAQSTRRQKTAVLVLAAVLGIAGALSSEDTPTPAAETPRATSAVPTSTPSAAAPSTPPPASFGNGSQDDEPERPTATTSAPGDPSPATTPARSVDPSPRGDGAPVVLRSIVANVVDGDTVDLGDGTRVRLAIVDTPEVHGGAETCGREASEFTRDFVLGRGVRLYRPEGAPRVDDFGRLVAEVVRDEDGASLNVALVKAGLARVDERFTDEDPDLAARARAAGADADDPVCEPVDRSSPSPQPSADPTSQDTTAGSGHTGRTDGGWSCHPAYRECLPSQYDDLACGEIGHRVHLTGNDDPWRLDGRSTSRDDGVGCESQAEWSASASYPYY